MIHWGWARLGLCPARIHFTEECRARDGSCGCEPWGLSAVLDVPPRPSLVPGPVQLSWKLRLGLSLHCLFQDKLGGFGLVGMEIADSLQISAS